MVHQDKTNKGKKKCRAYGDNGFEELGGYMAAKMSKLEGQYRLNAGNNAGIFVGIAIFVNGYTEPTGEELKRIMLSNGGTYHHYYSRSRTTHIIASNLPYTKVRNMDTSRIVVAAWVVESLQAGRVLDYTNYLLYTQHTSCQPKLPFSRVEQERELPVTDLRQDITAVVPGRSREVNLSRGVSIKEEVVAAEPGHSREEVPNNGVLNVTRCGNEYSKKVTSNYQAFDQKVHDNLKSSKISSSLITCESTFIECNNKAESISASTKPVVHSLCGHSLRPPILRPASPPATRTVEPRLSSPSLFSDTSSDGCVTRTGSQSSGSTQGDGCSQGSDSSSSRDITVKEETVINNCADVAAVKLDYSGEAQSKAVVPVISACSLQTEGTGQEEQLGQDKLLPNVNDAQGRKPASIKTNVSNTTNPNFLTDFYNNSRLHHISTMSTMFKEYVAELVKKTPASSSKERYRQWLLDHALLTPDNQSHEGESSCTASDRVVMHIDMDCFFVSVGLRGRPELLGKPVAVTHARGNRRSSGTDPSEEFKLYQERRQKNVKTTTSIDREKRSVSRMLPSSSDITKGECVTNVKSKGSVAGSKVDERFEDWAEDFDNEEIDEMLNNIDVSLGCSGSSVGHCTRAATADGSTSFIATSSRPKEALHTRPPGWTGDMPPALPRDEVKVPAKTARLHLDSTSSLSEVSSCSYEARSKGVRNGMFLGAALQLCPDLHTIPYDFDGYKEVARQLYDIVASYSRHLEAVSCDELYVEVGPLLRECGGTALLLARCIREHVTSVTGCSCSAGLGPSKLAARLATRLAKPGGQALLQPPALEDYISTLPVGDLPGVGPGLQHRLSGVGVREAGQLRGWGSTRLAAVVGAKTAAMLLALSRGEDNRPVTWQHVRKSVSAEVNYGIRFATPDDAEAFLTQLCEEAARRMAHAGVSGSSVTLKLKVRAADAPERTAKFMGHGVCDDVSRTARLPTATADPAVLLRALLPLLRAVPAPPSDLRGVGVTVTGLTQTGGGNITRFLSKRSAAVKTEENVVRGDVVERPSQTAASTSNCVDGRHCSGNMDKFLHRSMGVSGLHSKPVGSEKASLCPDGACRTLDLEVLRALPPDFRLQVVEEYKQLGFVIPLALETSVEVRVGTSDQEEPQPGPSRLGGGAAFERIGTVPVGGGPTRGDREPSDSSGAVSSDTQPHDGDDDTRSQAELSFLSALPPDLRAELLQDMKMKTGEQEDDSFLSALPPALRAELSRDLDRHKRVLNSLTSPVKLAGVTSSTRSSPVKGRSSPCKTRGSGGRGRGRRRPRKAAPAQEYGSIDTLCSPRKTVIPQPAVPIETVAEPAYSHVAASAPRWQEPGLCGAIGLPAVRHVVKAWVRECMTPGNEDTLLLGEYCEQLVTAGYIDTLDGVVKCLYRQVVRLGLDAVAWRTAYGAVVARLQGAMKDTYGAPLKLTEFCTTLREATNLVT